MQTWPRDQKKGTHVVAAAVRSLHSTRPIAHPHPTSPTSTSPPPPNKRNRIEKSLLPESVYSAFERKAFAGEMVHMGTQLSAVRFYSHFSAIVDIQKELKGNSI